MGLGMCLVYVLERYSWWGIFEGIYTGIQDLYPC